MRSLVTGVAGFIGSTLADTLVEMGDTVIGVDSFLDYYDRGLKEQNVAALRSHDHFELIEGSLQDLDVNALLGRCDRVFHLAAQAGVRASWGSEFSIYTTNNILATQQLLEAALQSDITAFVFASSSSVYGDRAALPMREDVPLHPVSPYGVSKLAAEKLVELYNINHGLRTASLRYFTVYGPRQRPDMAFHRLLKSARTGDTFSMFGDGRQTRDFTFVRDAVAATIAASQSGEPGAVYNIGGGSRVSMLDVIETIESITGKKLAVDFLEKQKGDMRDTYADTTAAQRDLAYAPRTSLHEGLEREWEWIQSL
jgi:nucleoside-diphosphate-sugar epimerase